MGRAVSRRQATRQREADAAAVAALMAEWGPDDRAEIDERTRLIRTLAECSVTWAATGAPVRTSVRAAADALAVGLDSPALRELAGLSERTRDDREVRDLVDRALLELGVTTIQPDGVEARLLVLRRLAADWLAEGGETGAVVSLVYSVIGDEKYDSRWLPLVRAWVELDGRLSWDEAEARREAPVVIARFLEATAGLKPTLESPR